MLAPTSPPVRIREARVAAAMFVLVETWRQYLRSAVETRESRADATTQPVSLPKASPRNNRFGTACEYTIKIPVGHCQWASDCMLRHTRACHWLELGGSLAALQQLLGHASVVTTQRNACVQREASAPFAKQVVRAQAIVLAVQGRLQPKLEAAPGPQRPSQRPLAIPD